MTLINNIKGILKTKNLDEETIYSVLNAVGKIINQNTEYGLLWEPQSEDLMDELLKTYPYFKRIGEINNDSKNNNILIKGDNLYALMGMQNIYMDKRTGKYVAEEDTEPVDIDDQANEIIDFRLGSMPYGEVRWIGQVLTVDGNRRAEVLNNAYFRKGRHTPLMILVKGGTLSDNAFTKLQTYMNEIEGEKGQHSFLILETENNETGAAFQDQKQPEVEIKDLASILQKDELFQEYQENGRKKTQSAFLLPDLYVGYTTDFNRATAQTAMEVTEKQVFQPERTSLAWVINNKLLNGYGFKHVEARFDEPDITNPDDIQKILNITERAGGLTPNLAKEYTYEVLGKDGCADYDGEWGNVPLAYSRTVTQSQLQANLGAGAGEQPQTTGNEPTGQNTKPQGNEKTVTEEELAILDGQIKKAELNDAELVPIMKEIRNALGAYREKAGD